MKLLKLWRTFKEGVRNYWRNGWLTFATVSVMSISLYVMSLTIIVVLGANLALKNIQDKINISVYFNPGTEKERIMEIKNKLSGYREIKSIEFVSKEKALDEFMQMTNNDPSIRQALEEIGENPLLDSLVVKAQNPEDYEIIDQAIKGSSFIDDISQTNYKKNEDEIRKLNDVIKTVEKAGFTIGAIFVVVAIMITFNTIRLTIYSHKQEFEVMRLVGASNMYVRMPHVFEGIMYGISSALVVLIGLFFTFQFVSPSVQRIVPKEILISFYYQNFSVMAIMLIFSGIFLGVVSGLIAIRRYLKV